jgi:hypothetical protein
MTWREASLEVQNLWHHVYLDVVFICAVDADQIGGSTDRGFLVLLTTSSLLAFLLSRVSAHHLPRQLNPLLARGRSIGHICLTLYLAAL